jgi:2-polyprenyl-3-methyl-5-hydroxy-6-metoxy-1,4-benzoquinol methylase
MTSSGPSSARNLNAMVRSLAKRVLYPIPKHLARNHIHVGADGLAIVRASIEEKVYGRRTTQLPADICETRLAAKLYTRLETDRRLIIPWLDHAKPLKGSRILEIGCGTGCSTVALVEQGAEVVGIDPDADAIEVAEERFRVYGIRAEFHAINSTQMAQTLGARPFDSIIFFATLEHMTVAERLAGLRDAWAMLPVGGHLVIVETPNRLWYYDGHTSMLPFFHWLPDELAFRYAAFSPRRGFRELWQDYNPDTEHEFLRTGRGASFHEFDVAIRPAESLKVVSSLSTFQGVRYIQQRSLLGRRYKAILRRIYPGIHPGFCDESLFLIIEKDALSNLETPGYLRDSSL